DACDFARFCSGLDFFAITDHAEALTPAHWSETKETIRQCNAVAGGGENPDLVAFTGFEWTQVGRTPEEHYGHKNVIFEGTADDELPTRPISATGLARQAFVGDQVVTTQQALSIPIEEFSQRQRYLDLVRFLREVSSVPECPQGVDVHELPADCRETAATPDQLFGKLRQWGFDSLVIPHGTTWGFYTPPGYTWDKQLARPQHDPDYQRLVEVMSGHGNSEQYRAWRATVTDGEGKLVCPPPSEGFEPCCHRAGEIVRARCGDLPAAICEQRVAEARQRYVDAGTSGHLTLPAATLADWGGCGQCRDCFLPPFMHRPGGSVQYMLARGNFDEPERPNHEVMGFIASSDNHTARPGTGYKETARRGMTEATGPRSQAWLDSIFTEAARRAFGDLTPRPEALEVTPEKLAAVPPFMVVHAERQMSFFLTGGLVAVHSEGRSRDAIWDALRRREVYGTTGPRILLWFDLIDAVSAVGAKPRSMPMGSEVRLGDTPHFRVKAVGAFKQKPGCPDWSTSQVPAERIARLCKDECYYPGDERHRITRIEVVRIRRQRSEDEAVAPLIEDVFQRIDCPGDAPTCEVTFEDPGFVREAREVVYYVRAIQEPTETINADNLRCQPGEGSDCARVKPCYGDFRTPLDDDCLARSEERAWSSPIYLRFDESLVPPEGEEE
ncbi:MAG: DUF3604 domain-containing protein, partial [Myxococcales bacterium]|nr:DUF3604 domain-containing protein [Myxococcales bacterium]